MGGIFPIPAAAQTAGLDRLSFFDDFDSCETVDLYNTDKANLRWYTDRPYGRPPLEKDELEWHTQESYVRIKGRYPCGLATASSKNGEGFTMSGGYVEARIRIDLPTDNEEDLPHPPLFYMLSMPDYCGRAWVDNGIITVFTCPRTADKQGVYRPYYVGSLHHYQRSWQRDKKGKPITRSASNLVNSTGYNDWFTFLDDEWHTYGLLWEKEHIAWFMDGKEMHSVRFGRAELPRHYYRGQNKPLPPLEGHDLRYASRQWLGAYTVFDNEEMVINLCSRIGWEMDVDWIRVWEK